MTIAGGPHHPSGQVRLDGLFLDSASVEISGTSVRADDMIDRMSPVPWDGESVVLDLKRGTNGSALVVGCYELEDFGVWTMASNPFVILPMALVGKFVLRIEARAFGQNVERNVTFTIGDCSRTARFPEQPRTVELLFEVGVPAHVLQVSGIDASSDPTSDDPRSLGIGLSSLTFEAIESAGAAAPSSDHVVDTTNNRTEGNELVGFHPAESWGSWTSDDMAWVNVPQVSPGRISIDIGFMSHARNIGREIVVECGGARSSIPIVEGWNSGVIELTPNESTGTIQLSGWLTERDESTQDPRRLGIGVGKFEVRQIALRPRWKSLLGRGTRPTVGENRSRPRKAVSLVGTTKTFAVRIPNGSDHSVGMDIVSGFLWAFRHDKEAILFMVTGMDRATEDMADVLYLLSRVGDAECRVVVVPSETGDGIPKDIADAATVFICTDAGQLASGFASVEARRGRPAIVSLPSAQIPVSEDPSVSVVPMMRRPARIHAARFGHRRQLVDTLDWGRLAATMRDEGRRIDGGTQRS